LTEIGGVELGGNPGAVPALKLHRN
jgi:hypothetical protein